MTDAPELIDLYAVLGVAKDATPDQIKRAFKTKAKGAHPDVGGDPADFDRLMLARTVLLNPEWRSDYDHHGLIPKDQADNAIALLLQTLTGVFGQVMHAVLSAGQDPADGDFVSAMRQAIKENIDGQNKQINQIVMTKTKLGRVMGRFKMKNLDQANHMETIVDGQMKQFDAQIKACQTAISMQENARQYLEAVSFAGVQQTVRRTTFFATTGATV